MKVTTEILKSIPKGSSSTFKVDSPRDLNTARTLANYVARFYPELGIRFSCKVNYATNEITISSIASQKKSK